MAEWIAVISGSRLDNNSIQVGVWVPGPFSLTGTAQEQTWRWGPGLAMMTASSFESQMNAGECQA
ncbi:hypothetical protein GE21DRAFT_1285238 [Neurospora crassa]|nr:hypothetical protein GE21DRAFT_1285238 [Neurospora crassa]